MSVLIKVQAGQIITTLFSVFNSLSLRFWTFCPHPVSVHCTPVIGQYAGQAKYNRLENVCRITLTMSLRKQTPSDFLKQIIGRPVVVKLNSGVDYRGVLACLDGYMNIAIEQTEEYVNGQLKNKYGDAFLRGNNVLYISTQKRKA
uniref:U6 snRNA-associated Sm-like protein LSm6 n=1 Tax=Gasterosteus aculeatus aculeatus TaxID=481459 RepID=A0AAQ4Q6I3_GASAC